MVPRHQLDYWNLRLEDLKRCGGGASSALRHTDMADSVVRQ